MPNLRIRESMDGRISIPEEERQVEVSNRSKVVVGCCMSVGLESHLSLGDLLVLSPNVLLDIVLDHVIAGLVLRYIDILAFIQESNGILQFQTL